MAQRRMFSLKVIDTDNFLDMSPTAQNLYFHLGMRADDDGFVSRPKQIMRMVGAPEDDMKVLIAKGFVIPMSTNGICVITHWKMNNLIKKYRYTETIYKEEKAMLSEDNGMYYNGFQNGSKCVPKVEPQVRLGKVRLGKVSNNIYSGEGREINKVFEIFSKINPTINWGNKTTRKAAAYLIKKFGLKETLRMAEMIVAVQGKKFAPVATTPYQMKEKLAQFRVYFKQKKEAQPSVAFVPNADE